MEIWNKIINFCSEIEIVVDVSLGLVIILVTIFTAWWTHKTFAHKEKINELKELKNLIMEYSEEFDFFFTQAENNGKPNNALFLLYKKFIRLNATNLYTNPKDRDKIQKIVGKWLTDSERLKAMQSKKSEENKKAWAEYENEYKEVIKIIDKKAKRLV